MTLSCLERDGLKFPCTRFFGIFLSLSGVVIYLKVCLELWIEEFEAVREGKGRVSCLHRLNGAI